MPSYSSLLSNPNYQGNAVIRIGGTGPYYTIHTPDSDTLGTIVVEKSGYIQDLSLFPQVLDIEEARTTFATFSFKLIDKDNDITERFRDNPTIFSGMEVEIWLGRIGVSHDFQDYLKLQKTIVTAVSFDSESFTFKTREVTERFKRPAFNLKDQTNVDHAAGAGTIFAKNDISGFPASGEIKIDNELLTYSAKNNGLKTFTLVGVTSDFHSAGADIFNVVTVASVNPIDFFLQFCISNGGGGPYDVLSDGLGIDQNEFDISDIETNVRDQTFSGQLFSFKLYGIEDGLEFLTTEILKTCSCRIVFSENSLITLTVMDQVVFGQSLKKFDQENILPKSVKYIADDTKIRNVVRFLYDYNHETGEYESTFELRDSLSITRYGERKPLEITSQGVKTSLAGALIASDRVSRWLSRLKNITPRISIETFVDVHLARNGERVQVEYDLPTPIGDRVFNYELEITKKSFEPIEGRVQFDVGFTTYTGTREAFISPTDNPVLINSQSSIDVTAGRGLKWRVGWKVRLYLNGNPEPDAINEILSISGDTITFVNAFTTVLTLAHYIKFPDYDDIAEDQKRYCFLSDNGNDFADGTPPYQITF